LGAWDKIGVGSTDFALVQVKTRDWPGSVETENLNRRLASGVMSAFLRDRTHLKIVREIIPTGGKSYV
jgi:hypothetical protein